MYAIKYLTLVCALLTITACGSKGPVRPLETPEPGSVTALELRQQGSALLLGWQLPTRNRDGSLLEQPPMVDIYRMTFDPKDDCPECLDRSTLLVSIDPQLPKPALQLGQRYLLYDRDVQVGKGYQYKLVTRNEAGEVGKAVILRQNCAQAIAAPLQFQVTPRDRSVQLQWQPLPLLAGDRLIGYQLYRRNAAGGSLSLLNQQPLQQPAFEDFSLDNGTRYHYRVRALIKRNAQLIEGLASPELTAIPKAGI